jgi:hypothetical protein
MKCEIIAKKIKSSALSHGPNSVYGRVLWTSNDTVTYFKVWNPVSPLTDGLDERF